MILLARSSIREVLGLVCNASTAVRTDVGAHSSGNPLLPDEIPDETCHFGLIAVGRIVRRKEIDAHAHRSCWIHILTVSRSHPLWHRPPWGTSLRINCLFWKVFLYS